MSCFRVRNESPIADQEPLLPHEDGLPPQRSAHQKMHFYQIIRALSMGFMPSTEQAIIYMRSLIASDILNPDAPGLSDTGKRLVKFSKQWIMELIELLKKKNDEDQLQDFISFLARARISLDTDDLIRSVRSTKVRPDASVVYQSIKTIGSLLMKNSDFRLFLSDLKVIGRQVFVDTANTVSQISGDAAEKVSQFPEPSEIIKSRNPDEEPALAEDLGAEASEIGAVVIEGIKKTGLGAKASLEEKFSENQRKILISRLGKAVAELRKRNDYSGSASTISLLIQQLAKVYSKAVNKTISKLQEDFNTNDALDLAIKRGWSLLTSFGDEKAWKELEIRVKKVMEHSQNDPEFERHIMDLATSIQQILTDPDSLEAVSNKLVELKNKSQDISIESPLKKDMKALLAQTLATLDSVTSDKDVLQLLDATLRISSTISPSTNVNSPELIPDIYNVFIPSLIQSLQYIPIPRLEVSIPEFDLLLENIVLQPGRSVNQSSFLPFNFKIKSFNEIKVQKAQFKTTSAVKSLVIISLDGFSLSATDVGYWLRMHHGIFRFSDEGIVTFGLGNQGMSMEVVVEIGENGFENIITLKQQSISMHNLTYSLRKSKFSCLAWILKPILRPLLRKTIEYQVQDSVNSFFLAANRELLFARERLRAAQISSPQSLDTFLKAMLTRFPPRKNPDLDTRIRVRDTARSRHDIFADRYAPGSLVKLWDEELARKREYLDENTGVKDWRNSIFDSHWTVERKPYND